MFYKGILLDLDDTLYSYNNAHKCALDRVYLYIQNVIDVNLEDLESMYNTIKTQVKSIVNKISSHNKGIYFKQLLEYYKILDHYKIVYDIYWDTFYNNMILFDNVIEYLKWHKENNIKIAIITNYETEFQIYKLIKLDILQYIDCVITSEEVGVEKPNPLIFNYTMSKLQLQVHELIMIGDNYDDDIKGAEMMGIKSFLVFNDFFTKTLNICKQQLLELQNLTTLSRHYGQRFDLTQAGGGNISVKHNNTMFIKASGKLLANVNVFDGYSVVDNKMLNNDLNNGIEKHVTKYIDFGINRPSIETYMHSILDKYVVHLHPIQVNKILTSVNCEKIVKRINSNALLLPYITPGINVCWEIMKHRNKEKVILLQNHGIIITSDDIIDLHIQLETTLKLFEHELGENYDCYRNTKILSEHFNNKYIVWKSNVNYDLSGALFPDSAIYCGIDVKEYDGNNIFNPLIKYNNNMYILSTTYKKCLEIEQVLKSISDISNNHELQYLNNNEINYLCNWESEKFRQKLC